MPMSKPVDQILTKCVCLKNFYRRTIEFEFDYRVFFINSYETHELKCSSLKVANQKY